MKKQLLFGALILTVAVSFTSCKKDYTCECKDNDTQVVESSTKITSRNKTLAKTACEVFNVSGPGGTTCTLK